MNKKTVIALSIVGAIIIAGGGFLYWSWRNQKWLFKFKASITTNPATLKLSPASGSYKVGEKFKVDILLDTKGASIDSVDVVIKYDSSILEAQDEDSSKTGIQIVKGAISGLTFVYPAEPRPERVIVSGVALGNPVVTSGEELFGSVYFTPKQASSSTGVQFEYGQGVTLGSNVWESQTSQNILASATGSTFTITAGETGSSCGDGICQANENCSQCPSDCGSCGTGGGGTGGGGTGGGGTGGGGTGGTTGGTSTSGSTSTTSGTETSSGETTPPTQPTTAAETGQEIPLLPLILIGVALILDIGLLIFGRKWLNSIK